MLPNCRRYALNFFTSYYPHNERNLIFIRATLIAAFGFWLLAFDFPTFWLLAFDFPTFWLNAFDFPTF
jgi:hypothetical protein